ncbi:hypothetical protein Ddc_18745 [Ditylenchus destructor]|nr:hypothetical protein Ddc_18745 [Ditylenchus destructor]
MAIITIENLNAERFPVRSRTLGRWGCSLLPRLWTVAKKGVGTTWGWVANNAQPCMGVLAVVNLFIWFAIWMGLDTA